MKFNDLPVDHKIGWVSHCDLIYKDMTPSKLMELLSKHNPDVCMYANGQCSTWLNDETREQFMKANKIDLKY